LGNRAKTSVLSKSNGKLIQSLVMRKSTFLANQL
jgi:hypothetical protein